jgi:hypothetical protein
VPIRAGIAPRRSAVRARLAPSNESPGNGAFLFPEQVTQEGVATEWQRSRLFGIIHPRGLASDTGFRDSGPYEPPEPSRLELLADDAGVGPDVLRDWLRLEIERRVQGPQGGVEPAHDGAGQRVIPQSVRA